MYHREVIAAVARRLPHQTRRDVREMIEVLNEIWFEELVSGGEVVLPDIGANGSRSVSHRSRCAASRRSCASGHGAAITRKLEGRMDVVEEQLQRQNDLLAKLVAFFKRKREA